MRSFLQSAADRLLTVFHADGLRIDAVSHAIYWMGDEKRGVNPGGINFLRSFNRGLRSRHPNILMIAEDSSSYPGVTASALDCGLDFNYKWDLGWMHDTFNYFRTPPAERPDNYNKISFSMLTSTMRNIFFRSLMTKSCMAKPQSPKNVGGLR